MPHETGLITTIVGGLVLAFIFGAIANRFRLPPLVGYLFAGILVGPYTPGYVADQELAPQLAEIGVILLMFGIGLHFSLKDLMKVRALAVPGAVVQIGFATLLGLGLALVLGWSVGAGLVFGLALSVASTVVLLRSLQERRLVDTERGHLAVGWLIVEDLAMILALVLIPAFAALYGGGPVVYDPFVALIERLIGADLGIFGVLAITVVKIAAFAGFMVVVGRRVIPWTLHAVAHTGNRELFRLAVLALALGVASGSAYLFGVSLALGAFFAGMILSESELSHRAAQETLPLRDAFSVLFFVSVGMLFDPSIVLREPLPVLATLFIILIGKSLAAFAIVVLFRRPVGTALTIAASLAQIGEFSFILAGLGVGLNILPQQGYDLILAGALLSIVLNPLAFWGAEWLRPRLEARVAARQPARGEALEPSLGEVAIDPTVMLTPDGAVMAPPDEPVPPAALVGHTVLIGFGGVGRVVAEGLKAAGNPFLVIEDADDRIAAANAAGVETVTGNAADPKVMALANIEAARCLLIAIPNAFEAGQATEQARKHNAGIRIVARAHSKDEEDYLQRLGADEVVIGEREIGLGMLAQLDGAHLQPAKLAPVAAIAPDERLEPSFSEPAEAATVTAEPSELDPTEEAAVSAESADLPEPRPVEIPGDAPQEAPAQEPEPTTPEPPVPDLPEPDEPPTEEPALPELPETPFDAEPGEAAPDEAAPEKAGPGEAVAADEKSDDEAPDEPAEDSKAVPG